MILCGRISGTHGVRGALSMVLFRDYLSELCFLDGDVINDVQDKNAVNHVNSAYSVEDLLEEARFYIDGDAVSVKISGYKKGGGVAIIMIDGGGDMDVMKERYSGKYVYGDFDCVDEHGVIRMLAGDLIGMIVQHGKVAQGIVTDVLNFNAAPVLVIDPFSSTVRNKLSGSVEDKAVNTVCDIASTAGGIRSVEIKFDTARSDVVAVCNYSDDGSDDMIRERIVNIYCEPKGAIMYALNSYFINSIDGFIINAKHSIFDMA